MTQFYFIIFFRQTATIESKKNMGNNENDAGENKSWENLGTCALDRQKLNQKKDYLMVFCVHMNIALDGPDTVDGKGHAKKTPKPV